MVLEISSNKSVDAELLEKLMVEVEKRASICLSTSTAVTHNYNSQVCPDDSQIVPHNELCAKSGVERSRETEQLLDCIGKVLQQVAYNLMNYQFSVLLPLLKVNRSYCQLHALLFSKCSQIIYKFVHHW